MAVDILDDFELERLRAEVQQERQMKEMLEQSATELKMTVDELDKRLDTIDDEGNEWKTRFETQEEMNQQLQRQIFMLQGKVEEARKNLKDASKTPRGPRNLDDISDANAQLIAALAKEKNSLQGQLHDLEWRLDQESKAYHQANEERKQYVTEINAAKSRMDQFNYKQKLANQQQHLDISRAASRTSRDTDGNIPEDQRIIDPKRGPIRKIAAVRSLPSLEM